MNKNIYFWFHLILLLLAYASPWLFNWQLIVIGVVLLQIQYWVIDGCYLTKLEMGKDKNQTFVWYYLKQIFPKLSAVKTKFVIRFVIPVILVGLGYYLQEIMNLIPLIIH